MNSRERMDAAMRPAEGRVPDRVPVMCQLALGHYFLNTGLDPADIWFDSRVFADALVMLQRRYGFDGILVNLPGRDPEWRRHLVSREVEHGRIRLRWTEGNVSVIPPDDNPRVLNADGRKRQPPSIVAVDPEQLYYVEPHSRLGVETVREFPPWQFDTLRHVREAARDVSVHGEVFSPFSQLVELLGPAEAMLALIDEPSKVKLCLERLARGAADLAVGLLRTGADALLISSAYAGAGFISRAHYEEFVLPFERSLIGAVKAQGPQAVVYTHTCGAIGDRLDLMKASGTDGIDTLDPPPLGTVDLADARRRLPERMFIKGNIDPVNTVLRGTEEDCRAAALERIAAAGRRGYVLSTACSVPPRAPAANVIAIADVAREAACVT